MRFAAVEFSDVCYVDCQSRSHKLQLRERLAEDTLFVRRKPGASVTRRYSLVPIAHSSYLADEKKRFVEGYGWASAASDYAPVPFVESLGRVPIVLEDTISSQWDAPGPKGSSEHSPTTPLPQSARVRLAGRFDSPCDGGGVLRFGFPFFAFVKHDPAGALDAKDKGKKPQRPPKVVQDARLRELFDYDLMVVNAGWEQRFSEAEKLAQREGWYNGNRRVALSEAHPLRPEIQRSRSGEKAILSFYVNFGLVERLLAEGKPCPYEWLLVQCALLAAKEEFRHEIVTAPQLHRPDFDPFFSPKDAVDFSPEDHNGHALRTQFFPHQAQALWWMKWVESRPILPFNPHACPWLGTESVSSVHVDTFLGTLVHEDSANQTGKGEGEGGSDGQEFLTSDGGLLCDEMGLGKTLVLLSLAATDQTVEPLARLMRLANDPASFPALPPDDEPIRSRFARWAIPTNCTLVVCPSHLVAQWGEEARKHMETGVKVVTVATSPQLEAVTYRDLLSSLVVVVNQALLKNPRMLEIGTQALPALFVETEPEADRPLAGFGKKRTATCYLPPAGVNGACRLARSLDNGLDPVKSIPVYPFLLPAEKPSVTNSRKRRALSAPKELGSNHVLPVLASLIALRRRLAGAARGGDEGLEAAARCVLDSRGPPLLHFAWRRIVMDEAHEIFYNDGTILNVKQLVSRNRWFVTGTPDPALTFRWSEVLEFLRVRPSPYHQTLLHQQHGYPHHMLAYMRKSLREKVLQHLYWRNTKDSIERALDRQDPLCLTQRSSALFGAGLSFETIEVLLSPVELGVYRQASVEASHSTKDPEERLIRICCHPQISKDERRVVGEEYRTLEQIRSILIEHHRKDLDSFSSQTAEEELRLTALKRTRTTRLAALIEEINAGDDRILTADRLPAFCQEGEDQTTSGNGTPDKMIEDTLEAAQRLLAGMDRDTGLEAPILGQRKRLSSAMKKFCEARYLVEESEKKLKSLRCCSQQAQSTIRFFASIGKDSEDRECKICCGENDAILRFCGHMACRECLVSLAKNSGKCFLCRSPLDQVNVEENFWVFCPSEHDDPLTSTGALSGAESDGSTPATKDRQSKALDEQSCRKLAPIVGSKIARLIVLLKRLKLESSPEHTNRAIVFSQFDDMLHRIGETMAEHGVTTVYCKGNVHAKTAAMRRFKADDRIDAILLSVDHCASGTNLQEATHVIFLDALLGDDLRAEAVQAQAIGRAYRIGQRNPVKVVHLITKDTVEESLHKRRQNNGNPKQNRSQTR